MDQIGYLGPQGTHSEAAARWLLRYLGVPFEVMRPFGDIYDVLAAVREGELAAGFVPVENSLEGSINVTLDALAENDDFAVRREVVWPVHNQLFAKRGTELGSVRRIYSHSQPFSQCRTFLQKHCAGAELIKVTSTAHAAQIVAESGPTAQAAAICTVRAGELNGLVPLAREIQDNTENCTRFYEIVRKDRPAFGKDGKKAPAELPLDKELIICQIDGSQPGALVNVLMEFATRAVNLTRIESRPARTKLGEYIFFFDIETSAGDKVLRDSIAAVRKKCIWLKDLGGFPVLTAKSID